MAHHLEFFFDFTSPYSYLAWTQLPQLIAGNDVTIDWQPIALGALFKASGNASPTAVPAKKAYLLKDLADQARWYNVPFAFNPSFPIRNTLALRVALACTESAEQIKWIETAFTAMWVHARDLTDVAVVQRLTTEAGLDTDTILARAAAEDIRQRLRQQTEDAVSRGIFGAPTFSVNGELFFGQDRLHLVHQALSKGTSSGPDCQASIDSVN